MPDTDPRDWIITSGKHRGRKVRDLLNSKDGLEYVRWAARAFPGAHGRLNFRAALAKAKL